MSKIRECPHETSSPGFTCTCAIPIETFKVPSELTCHFYDMSLLSSCRWGSLAEGQNRSAPGLSPNIQLIFSFFFLFFLSPSLLVLYFWTFSISSSFLIFSVFCEQPADGSCLKDHKNVRPYLTCVRIYHVYALLSVPVQVWTAGPVCPSPTSSFSYFVVVFL